MREKKIAWKNEYKTGVPWIDEQHKHFFTLLKEIMKASRNRALTRKDLLFCLTHLFNHAFYHFDSEEKYLANSKYPGVKQHVASHAKYRSELRAFLASIREQKTDIAQLADRVAAFAQDWLFRHMLGVHKEQKLYLKSGGEKRGDRRR